LAKFFYTTFLFLYYAALQLAALWNPKAKKWLDGRKNNLAEIANKLQGVNEKIIWMHCASLGEFEQGKPLLEQLKMQNENHKIVLTFFSPSGYEAAKNYTAADYIFYLPMDNYFAAKKFIDAVNPSLVLWVKYEYWYYYLKELKKRNIPVLLISGIFRSSQPFFKWYGGIWKEMLTYFNHFFVQNEASKKLLGSIGITKNITISGDTRFDRVIEVAQQQADLKIITAFCADAKVMVAGSTWEDDEAILAAYADETHHELKLIIVPHELDAAHIDSVKKIFKQSVCYTAIEKDPSLLQAITTCKVLIVDTIGLLSRLYSYGYINYIGGGFTNDGIHNILEAAVWGKPIIIGENYEKYFEAIDLIECGAAETISDTNQLKEVIATWLNNTDIYNKSSTEAKNYVYNNKGATKKIMEYIQVNRLLTI
jgi:3-deoxy-D-manno-octulosonic-acid transferase